MAEASTVDLGPGLGRLLRRLVGRWVAVVLIASTSLSAHGWGADGHELIAELAWQQLPEGTRQRIELLLAQEPGLTFVSIASWADRVRSPSTARWHYVNFPEDAGCRFDGDRDCLGGNCVVAAIERQARRLARTSTPEERLVALKWLVHLIGDVHQPLHAGFSEDKGGNLIQLRAFGRGTNLHALWDTGLIANWPGGLAQLKAETAKQLEGAYAHGGPADWAEESCRIVEQRGFKPNGRVITDADHERWRPILAARLALASKRLASILQFALR